MMPAQPFDRIAAKSGTGINSVSTSADVGDANGGIFSRLWLRRQLKNRSLLALAQQRQQHDPPIRKFQRVVMRRQPLLVDLSENRCLVVNHLAAPGQQAGRLAGRSIVET